MTSSISAKPATDGLHLSVERASVQPVRGAVATELRQAVHAADGSVNTQPGRSHTSADMSNPVLDAQSREVLFRALEWSRRVTRQVPDVAARRLKAYTRSAEQQPHREGSQTDKEL